MSRAVIRSTLTIIVLLVLALAILTFPAEAGTYIVQDGDMSLWCIAHDQGIDFWSLVLANSGPELDPNLIRVGDVIVLP